jgi:hypothetical protein
MKMDIPLWIKEILEHLVVECYPFLLLLRFLDLQNTVEFKLLFMILLPISILQSSAMGSLLRMSVEENSDDWSTASLMSFGVRSSLLTGARVVSQLPKSIPISLVFTIFIAIDVYVTKSVLNSAAALQERIESKASTK